MNKVKTALVSLALTTTTHASALEWQETVTRGMVVHTIQLERGAMWLVCDPDRVFEGTSNASLSVEPISNFDADILVIISDDDIEIRLPMYDDKVWESRTDPEQWHRMVSVIGGGGSYQIFAGEKQIALREIPRIPNLHC